MSPHGRRDHLTYSEAIVQLGIALPEAVRLSATPHVQQPRGHSHPAWQEKSRSVVDQALAALWSAQGDHALTYLRGRGLSDQVIREAALGYRPLTSTSAWGDSEVYLPYGIVIPNISGGHIFAVNAPAPAGRGTEVYPGKRQ